VIGTLRVPIRPAGAALLVAGMLVATAAPHPSIIGDRRVAEVVLSTGTWRLMHFAVLVGCVAAAFGVVGLVAMFDGRLGRVGDLALAAAIVGLFVTASTMAIEATVFPEIARRVPEVIDFDGPIFGSVWLRALGSFAGGFQLGLAALGLLAYREGTHRRAAVALIVGPVGFLALGLWFVPYVGPASTVAFGASMCWWGWILLSSEGSTDARAEAVPR
jgi:hypothetical protein